MHLVIANSSFPSITARILFQTSARCATESLLRAWLHLQQCFGEGLSLCLPKFSCQVHPRANTPGLTRTSATRVQQQHTLGPRALAAVSLSSQKKLQVFYQQLQEHTACFYSSPPTSSRISTAQLVVQVTI